MLEYRSNVDHEGVLGLLMSALLDLLTNYSAMVLVFITFHFNVTQITFCFAY